MTDEERMKTSEIRDRLQHRTSAVTRAWISALPEDVKLEVVGRDKDTGEKEYLRSQVEAAIRATHQRGPYGRRPPAEEPHSHELDHHRPPDR